MEAKSGPFGIAHNDSEMAAGNLKRSPIHGATRYRQSLNRRHF
jgi:hypothetical protein